MLPHKVCKLPVLSVEFNDPYPVLDFLQKKTGFYSIRDIKIKTSDKLHEGLLWMQTVGNKIMSGLWMPPSFLLGSRLSTFCTYGDLLTVLLSLFILKKQSYFVCRLFKLLIWLNEQNLNKTKAFAGLLGILSGLPKDSHSSMFSYNLKLLPC